MIRIGSKKYKKLFPETKKHVGRPSKKEKWDPIVDIVGLVKEFSELNKGKDKKDIDEMVNIMSNRKFIVTFSNGKVFEFLAKRRKEFLAELLNPI